MTAEEVVVKLRELAAKNSSAELFELRTEDQQSPVATFTRKRGDPLIGEVTNGHLLQEADKKSVSRIVEFVNKESMAMIS